MFGQNAIHLDDAPIGHNILLGAPANQGAHEPVQVQERAGLLERKPFPQPLFSPNEIRRMMPSLQKTLQAAKPTEWAVFYSALPGGAGQEVTSGGIFVKGNVNQRLRAQFILMQ